MATILRTPVASSNVSSIGYDATEQVLEVEFSANGRVYQYEGVPQEVYDALMASPSKGRFLNAAVKDVYPVSEV